MEAIELEAVCDSAGSRPAQAPRLSRVDLSFATPRFRFGFEMYTAWWTAAQAANANAVTTRTAGSSRLPDAGGLASGRFFLSQFRVKLGMIRPPTNEINIGKAATPMRLAGDNVHS